MLLLCLDTATPVLSVGVVRLPGVPPTENRSDNLAEHSTENPAKSTADHLAKNTAENPSKNTPENPSENAAEVLAERVEPVGHRHGERLTPAITEVLAAAEVAPRDLDALVVGLGPGPFTGLRIGIVTAAALGDATGIPAYGVCSLDALAQSTPEPPALVATDARRREVYWATYDASRRRRSGPAVDRPAAVAPLLAEAGITAGVGAGAVAYADVLGLTRAVDAAPTPAGLALAARSDDVFGPAPAPLTPLYLRRPDAAEPHRPKQVTPA